MTQAFWQWSNIVNDLLIKRKANNGILPKADEMQYAAEITSCEQLMTEEDRHLVEVLVRYTPLERILPRTN